MGLKLTPFTVAGKVNSGAFQKSCAIAQSCSASASAIILPLLPADYEKLLLELQELHGGPAYLHQAGVVVYSEQAGFIGDDAAFVRWLEANDVRGIAASTNSNGKQPSWDEVAEKQFQSLLTESGRTFAFLELDADGEGSIGRLVFELYPDLAPKTCDNFLELCEKSEGGYKGSPIHRVKAGAWLQAGDTATGNGDGGASASGHALPDESFAIHHDTYGILGMANTGHVHSAQSQFYVTFAPCPCFDQKYVAFGKLVDGTKLLRYLEEVDTSNERPLQALTIVGAGRIVPLTPSDKSFYEDEDAAAAKLQAMHKGRLKRKEMQERKAAAAKLQAVKRGQAARKEAEEQKAAAVKMQSLQRGRKARRAPPAA